MRENVFMLRFKADNYLPREIVLDEAHYKRVYIEERNGGRIGVEVSIKSRHISCYGGLRISSQVTE